MSAGAGTRPATASDLGAIMALERASFPGDAWSEAMMREELASPHSWYVVVEEAGRLIGYAGLRAPRGATDADIQTITIASTARGEGRGRALLIELLDEAVRRRVRDVFLDVRADNPVAQALYSSEGFAQVGRRAHYYQPDDVDAIVMRLDLAGWAERPGAAGAAGVGGETPRMPSRNGLTRPESANPAPVPWSSADTVPTTDAGACT